MPSRTTERPGADATTRRSRRAFARRQWARRWLTWKYVLASLALVGLVGGGIWLFLFSSVLAVQQVEVSGTDSATAERVHAVSDEVEGEPLARVDLAAVRARVQALEEVRSATVTRQWPDTVVVEVEERVAVAVVAIGGRLRGLDTDGAVFDDYRKAPPGLPRVETAPDAGRDALGEAATVVSSLPDDLAERVDHVEVGTVDQISLVLRDQRVVLWGSAEDSSVKAETVVAALRERPGTTYDVSVPGQLTVRP